MAGKSPVIGAMSAVWFRSVESHRMCACCVALTLSRRIVTFRSFR